MPPDVTGLLYVLLGVGGGGGLIIFIQFYRQWKSGKLQDEDQIIKRVKEDNTELRSRLDQRDKDVAARDLTIDTMRRDRWLLEDQIAWYRRQLIENDITVKYPGGEKNA